MLQAYKALPAIGLLIALRLTACLVQAVPVMPSMEPTWMTCRSGAAGGEHPASQVSVAANDKHTR